MAKPKAPDCPCGGGRTYPECCGRYHAGAAAPTAEALMRSRYSAYVLGVADYLEATWHERTRPESLALDGEARVKWLGLEVIRHEELGDDQALVEFSARYKVNGKAFRMRETSRFIREAGRWYYVDGDVGAA